MTDLNRKLNLKPGMRVWIDGGAVALAGIEPAAGPDDADGVIVFVRDRADLTAREDPVVAAAREDRIAWVAYPKGGGLGTDLDRDRFFGWAEERGIRPVRQVAIDDTWSGLRFRPAG